MLNQDFVQMINNELAETADFCVWEGTLTEGIIRSTIEACILFLGYLKTNKRTSTVVFTDNIDGGFLFNIKSTFINDGTEKTYALTMSFEDDGESDEDLYYFTDTPELTEFLKIYAKTNYDIYYCKDTLTGMSTPQIIFYIIPVVFTCVYNFVMGANSPSDGILDVKNCVTFKFDPEGINIKFSPQTKQLFKSDKYLEIMNSES